MTVPGVQIDSIGRVKIDQYGRVILARDGDPCCCTATGGMLPCDECYERTIYDCPGYTEPTYSPTTVYGSEYFFQLDASGETKCTIAPLYWVYGDSDTSGLWYTPVEIVDDQPAIPDAPPEGINNVVDMEWTLSVVVHVRCVNGVIIVTASGSAYCAYSVWNAETGAYDTGTVSTSWTDAPLSALLGQGLFDEVAEATAFIDPTVFGGPAFPTGSVPGFWPPVTAPLFGCSQSFPNGSLTFSDARRPFGRFGGDGVFLWFLPVDGGFNENDGTATASNDSGGYSQSASWDWTLYATGTESSPDLVPAGYASQEFSLTVQLLSVQECEEGAMGGL